MRLPVSQRQHSWRRLFSASHRTLCFVLLFAQVRCTGGNQEVVAGACEATGQASESPSQRSEEDIDPGASKTPLDIGVKQELKGPNVDAVKDVIRRTEQYVRDELMAKPELRQFRYTCKNRHELCAWWAAAGLCETYAEYMKVQCAPSCQSCDKLDMSKRCPLDPNANDALAAGDLNRIFERLIGDDEYAGFIPIVLSRPNHVNKLTENDQIIQSGSWVVAFENFASPEECDRLISLGVEEGYARSTEMAGRKSFDGKYNSRVSSMRTSETAWCNETCYEDPVARNITERIVNFTGIPEPNMEHLQLLKYEVGQFYETHHDYIPHDIHRQQGPRVLTFFLYLSDVEEGGGTNFPLLNLTVTPRKGKAVVWPNVQDSNPNAEDARTKHQALPVRKGIKYGANVWVHMRDFKGPLSRNCN